MTSAVLLAMAIAVAAGLMRGFAGVGSGMLMAPFFVVLFGPVDTVAMIIVMELVVTAQLLPGVRKHIDWRTIAPMGLAAAALMPFGGALLLSLDPQIVARTIAAVVLLFSAVLLFGWRYEGRRPLPASVGVGALSGFLMALTSLGNPPVMIYLLSSRDSSAANRANFTGYFAITLCALILLMSFSGMVSRQALQQAAILLPGFILAAWFGSRLFRRSSEALYRRVALGLLVCAGLYGLLR
jgi:uncharacterized membrane protein YfcA